MRKKMKLIFIIFTVAVILSTVSMSYSSWFPIINGDKVTFLISEKLKTLKSNYAPNEKVSVVVNMKLSGGNKDWVGIYPKNSDNSWDNVIAWNWVPSCGVIELNIIKKPGAMVAGEYEVRLFYNNSFVDEAKYSFTVGVQAVNYAAYGPYEAVEDIVGPRIRTYKPEKDGVIKQNSPVVIFSTGGWNSDITAKREFINFVVSKGYFVIGVTTGSDREPEFQRILSALNSQGNLVDKSKIGLMGTSTGGGSVFYNLKRLKDSNYAANSFAISLDGWFPLGLTAAQLHDLNTTTLLLQFGGADGLDWDGDSDVNNNGLHYQDPRILMGIYNKLPGDDKALSFLNNDTHAYVSGSMAGKEDMLEKVGAMLAYKFENGGQYARSVALENRYNEIVAPDTTKETKWGDNPHYRYTCVEKIYMSPDVEQNFNYCNVNEPKP